MEKTELQKDDWIQRKWRPMMAIMYMVVCIFDFILFPIGFTLVQFWEKEAANDAFRQWEPLTLVGAGLFHMAMGAVLGITAWSRGQEKIAGVSTNGFTPTAYNQQISYNQPQPYYQQPQQQNYSESSYVTMTPVSNGVVRGYGGKKAPPPAFEPEI